MRFAAVRSRIPDYLYVQLEHSARGERVMRGLNGKTAIVTGGASGIGRAISQRLAEASGSQIAGDKNPSPA